MAKSAYALALRYGQAVFDIAAEHENYDTMLANLETLASMAKDKDVLFFLENPRISLTRKREIIDTKLQGVNPMAMNLLYLLVERGGLGMVPDIAVDFKRRLDDLRGIAHAEVVSAVDLSDVETAEIRQQLGKVFNKQIEITTKVEPALLGGIVARVGDKVIDGSLSRRLQDLKREIYQARL
ncbi:ATP synthase F1 subunit delta [Dehalogenimonas sp. THU2]|uniref:ATP synthase F1 subunit delta n=1 Tax=Dehalogenimonas sp. THU2 TaxID=3151121 RepID=UPI00321880E4